MIALICFALVTAWEYHRHGLQGALSYVVGISLVIACLAAGLPAWICFIFVIGLCLILNKLPRKDLPTPPEVK